MRRICVPKRWLKLSALGAIAITCGLLYGFYGLTQQAKHLRIERGIERENQRLRAENEKQRQELQHLDNRIGAVEDTSRRLAEKSGVAPSQSDLHGQGGPAIRLDSAGALAALEARTTRLEREFRVYEDALRRSGMIPSLWPVDGKLEAGFGARRNPFGRRGYEFHFGLDILVPWGTPVMAAARGSVRFAGWQHGYGRVVYVDHGGGLSTRYGHLSRIEVRQGQIVARGEEIGRVGSSGRSTGPHLHYEVRINDEPVDPRAYLPAEE
jgi:murein DD-endopeptidase MepM/ murein hydrolase activator NlpD